MRNKMSASTSEKRSNRDKAKSTPGWTAFDLEQRRKQRGLEYDDDHEAYPMLSGSIAPKSLFNKKGTPFEKPFSSVVVSSMDLPSLTDAKNRDLQRQVPLNNSCHAAQNIKTEVNIEAHRKPNYIHPWADETLIRDVVAGVNNNIDEALSLVEAMLVSDNKDLNVKKVESDGNDFESFDTQSNSLKQRADMGFVCNNPFSVSYKESEEEVSSVQPLDAARFFPIEPEPEPEWEEDDVYLIHRKDAIKMIRSASRHSKASNDAYIRGDHISARRLSLVAQEERFAAEKLNAKAAKDILTIRNRENDPWTLDLHGLHAVEAVGALRERLQTVESLVPSNCFMTLAELRKESGTLAESVQCTTNVDIEKFGRHHPSTRLKQTFLQVITGKGNHSAGLATLPSAIRNFLNENGYHFDENRPGTIMIRPKFRQR